MADLAAINMRVPLDKVNLIDCAADILGQNRTTFMIDAALREAEHLLLRAQTVPFDYFEKALGV